MNKATVSPSSGTFNSVGAGSTVSGNAIFIGGVYQKVKNLSATVAVTAATSTITLAARWEVSNDNSTWLVLTNGSQNAAAVVLATGTTTIVTKVVPAPDAVYGWKFARIAVGVGVTTGATGDLYALSYNYTQLSGAEHN